MNRTNRPTQTAASPAPAPAPAANNSSSRGKKGLTSFLSLKIANIVLLFSITILAVALLWVVAIRQPSDESAYVDTSKMQAVFLNGGQVYFGHIRDLNDDFIRLRDIYYLRVDQQVQPDQEGQPQTGTPVLVRLGCELHRPQDEMLINRDQVVFWENLKDDESENTVPGAVKKYIAANPSGQDCNAQQQTQTETPAETPAATPSTNSSTGSGSGTGTGTNNQR